MHVPRSLFLPVPAIWAKRRYPAYIRRLLMQGCPPLRRSRSIKRLFLPGVR